MNELIGYIIVITIAVLIIIVFAIAKSTKESKLKRICKKIARNLLLGIISLNDKDRDAIIER